MALLPPILSGNEPGAQDNRPHGRTSFRLPASVSVAEPETSAPDGRAAGARAEFDERLTRTAPGFERASKSPSNSR
jgi:hypothetical protein